MRTPRLILLLGAVLFGAGSCEATVQIIGGTTATSNLVTNATGYLALSQVQSADQANVNGLTYSLMPTGGMLWNLCASVVTAPGASNGWSFAFYKNGSAQTTTLTISGAGTKQACDTLDAVHVAQGDLVAIQKTIQSGTPAASPVSWCLFFTPDVPGETILFGGGTSQTGAANWALSGSNISAGGGESSVYLPVPAAGTLKKMCGKVSVAAGAGNSWIWTMHDGGSAMSPSLAVTAANTTAPQCDTTDTPAVAAGDNIDVAVTVAGTPASTDMFFGAVFVPGIAGQFIISNTRISSGLNAGSNTYIGAAGRVLGSAVESNAAQIWLACTIQAVYIFTATDPGAGKTLEFQLRNGASTAALNATITHSIQNPSTTGASISIPNLNTIDTLVVPSGTPTLPASVAVSYLGYIPPQVPSQIY